MPGFKINDVGKGAPASVKPIMSYSWEVTSLGSGKGAIDKDLLIFSESCTLPRFTATKEEVQGAVLTYKYASGVKWEDVKLTFYDVVPEKSKTTIAVALDDWRDKVYTSEQGLGMANDYKQDSILSIIDATGAGIYKWTLHGSWPSSIGDSQLTYTSSNVKLVDVTITYDDAERIVSASL